MALGDGIRRNIAHVEPAERALLRDAFVELNQRLFSGSRTDTPPGGVSWWFKQDEIHQATHVHDGPPEFLPWHREIVNRLEAMLREVNPQLSLHYWDWTQNPTAIPNANLGGGTTGVLNLFTPDFMGYGGTAPDLIGEPWLSAGYYVPGAANFRSTDPFDPVNNNPADPPREVTRSVSGSPMTAQNDQDILDAPDFPSMRVLLENAHNAMHGFVNMGGQHTSFRDPFVFLLHANVDRLFAMWQTLPGSPERLDPDAVYGSEGLAPSPLDGDIEPWSGQPPTTRPWAPPENEGVAKTYKHASVVNPPCYDTLPLTVEQVGPVAGDPVRFVDVVEFLPTARALRLRVRGCVSVHASASATAPFTVLSGALTSPVPTGFEEHDLLIWVLFTPGADGSGAAGSLTASITETGDVFTVPITATVVGNPTVATSLVLDRSGSMNDPSGLPLKTRMDVLHEAAPLFVTLLDDSDGVGVVRFDTDAAEGAPVAPAGPIIGGGGRLAASSAISSTATNPGGLTAIGDGLESAAAQLTPVSGDYDSTATIVFTDGHETADKTIAAAASSVNSTVFAIGLGTADQLNPGALSDIANATNGYLLLTGNPGVDDQLLLQKYFAQVLAGATNAVVIVDPDGFVPSGGQAAVPFDLTDADIRVDALILGEMAQVLRAELVAPDGTVLSAGAGADEGVGQAYRVLRVVPADVLAPQAATGEWKVVLSVDDAQLKRWLREFRQRTKKASPKRGDVLYRRFVASLEAHGVPYTVSVQARSALRLGVQLTQHSRRPGAAGRLRATLTDSGIPLDAGAAVSALITRPDGSEHTLELVTAEPGVYTTDVPTNASGVYRVLVRAQGADLRGTRFTREELRTLAVWARGDDPPPTVIDPGDRPQPQLDLCGLLQCLLDDDGVRALLERTKINPDRVRRCVKRACAAKR